MVWASKSQELLDAAVLISTEVEILCNFLTKQNTKHTEKLAWGNELIKYILIASIEHKMEWISYTVFSFK